MIGVARRRSRPVAWLEIDGFPRAFYSGSVSPGSPGSLAGRTLHPGLNAWSGTSSRLDLLGAVSEAGRLSVQVVRTRTNGASDLLRKAPIGARALTTLAVTLPPTATALAVVCADPIDAFPASGILHIGQEAIYYPSKNNGTRTFAAGTRAQLGSQFGAHVADLAGASTAPRVYADCVTWRRRPARLWIADLRADGVWVDPVCELDGFVSGPPQLQADGLIEIELESVASALDAEVGGSVLQAGLQRGWHAFDGVVGDRFNVVTQVYPEGAALDVPLQGPVAAGDELLQLAHGELASTFDLGSGDSPRAGFLVSVSGEQLTPLSVAGDQWDGTGTVVLATGEPLAPMADRSPVRNARAEVRQSVSCLAAPGSPQVVAWPAGAVATWNSTLALPVTAPAGSFAQTLIDPAGVLAFTAFGAAGLRVRLLGPNRRTCWGLALGSALPAIIAGEVDHDWPAWRPPADGAELVLDGSGSEAQAYTWGGVAAAFYQPGERWLHADQDIFASATDARPLTILATTQWRGEEVLVLRRVVARVAASTVTGGAPGTLAVLRASDREGLPLADLPGEPPTVLQAVAAFRDTAPTAIMLRLLLSVGGTGANDPVYDVLPFGAGLRPAQVDVASFTGFGEGPFPRRSFVIKEGTTLRKLISALARSIGAVIVESLSLQTGRRRLALAPAGLPTPLDAVATVAQGDWLTNGRPNTTSDGELVNRVVFTALWQPALSFGQALEEEAEVTVGVTDQDSGPANGGAQAEELDLLGAQISASSAQAQRAAVLPLAAERFASFGFERPKVTGQIPYGDAVGIDAGSVVLISGAEVIGHDGQPVAPPGVAARVTGIDRDALAAKATITACFWGLRTTGWAPAMRVQGVLSTTVVDVVPQHYAPRLDRRGQVQVDPDLFEVGDAVLCVPIGARSLAVATTITAKAVGVSVVVGALNRITFAAPHGLVAGDSIRPQAYTAVTSRLQGYAFQGDAATLLLGASDAAQRYT